jgi:PAS domain S-box-containing protein
VGGEPSDAHGRSAGSRRGSDDLLQHALFAAAETSDALVGILDPHCCFLYLNAAGRRMLEIGDAEDASALRYPDFLSPGARRAFRERWVPRVRREEQWHDETTIRARSGGERPVVQTLTAHWGDSGRIEYYSLIVRDVTRFKQIERELRESNGDLERFASVASHDLQEPLRTMASLAQLLAQQYRGRLDDEADQVIEHIVQAAERMRRLVKGLLAYARLGDRGDREGVPCETILSEVLGDLDAVIAEKGAVVTWDPLPVVRGDRRQIAQLFSNLLANAVKYCGPRLPPRVHVSARSASGSWLLSIRDRGIGIDTQYHEQVFALFRRLDRDSAPEGTGMGLAICKRIVEAHGGRIWVESAEGCGATFCFTLPGDAEEGDERGG